jgi:hypothetical protein
VLADAIMRYFQVAWEPPCYAATRTRLHKPASTRNFEVAVCDRLIMPSSQLQNQYVFSLFRVVPSTGESLEKGL